MLRHMDTSIFFVCVCVHLKLSSGGGGPHIFMLPCKDEMRVGSKAAEISVNISSPQW